MISLPITAPYFLRLIIFHGIYL